MRGLEAAGRKKPSLVLLSALLTSGCLQMIGLSDPPDPVVTGAVEARGGSLGTWKLVARDATPAPNDVRGIDITGDAVNGQPVIRVASVAPPPSPAGAVGSSPVWRETQLRVATHAARGHSNEVLLTADHCARLDSIFLMHKLKNGVLGSARFDCSFPTAGHLEGDLEFSAGVYGGEAATQVTGRVDDTDNWIGAASFRPNRCAADGLGVLLWDARRPRILFDVRHEAQDTSITGRASNASLRVTSTEPAGKSFNLASEACRVLRLEIHETGYIKVGDRKTSDYAGSLEIECTSPGAGNLTGHLDFNC